MGQTSHKQEKIETKKNSKTITIVLTGTGKVGKTTIFKQFEFLFFEQFMQQKTKDNYESMELKNKYFCRMNTLLHFQKVLEIFNKSKRPIYDFKTEQMLNFILSINIYSTKSYWNSDVAEFIARVSQEETFQEILKNKHKYNLGDSTDYLLKRVKHFDSESPTIRMDYLRFVFSTQHGSLDVTMEHSLNLLGLFTKIKHLIL
jgi:GTPase SAR1 family protein